MEPGWQPTSIEFSSDGMDLLMATDRNVIMLLDGYEGQLVSSMSVWLLGCWYFCGQKKTYTGHTTVMNGLKPAASFVPCFSPDLKYVLSGIYRNLVWFTSFHFQRWAGSNDGRVLAWDKETGEKVAEWQEHVGPVLNCRWNPVTAMFASTCFATIFW